MAKAYSLDLRRKVLAAWAAGGASQAAVAARFAVSESFGRDLSALQRQTGDVAARPRGGGRKALATPAVLDQLRAQAATANDATIAEHHAAMLAAGFALECRHRGPAAFGPGVDAQKKTLRDDEAQSERVVALRAAWPEQVAGVKAEDCVFVDESGVNRAMSRLYARSLRGTRAFGSAPRNWGDNVTVLGALSCRGALEPMVVNGSTNGAVFLTFLKEVLVPQLWAGAVVVLDNLAAHKVKGVRELVESVGARLLYLPPYSPDLNPIEPAWSKVKAFLRRVAARTTTALDAAIGRGLQTISASDARGFFRHCGYLGSLD